MKSALWEEFWETFAQLSSEEKQKVIDYLNVLKDSENNAAQTA